MKKQMFLMAIVLLFSVTTSSAHSLWINACTSDVHKPPHAMLSLGWGHILPMDDMLNSPNGQIVIEKFELIDPSLKKSTLLMPDSSPAKAEAAQVNYDLFKAELATQKIAFKKESKQGVYQVSAVSKPTFYTQYIDTAGKPRMQLKPMDQLDNIKKVLMAVKFQAFAKSFITLGEWVEPKPLGHGLEIIPKTDLSDVHVGDLVQVEVLFQGKPLNATAKSIDYITAHSDSFGQSDGFSLFSYIMEGKAQFRVQSAGQWMISVNHKDDVTPDGDLKALVGKAEQVYHAASLTFTVK
ncbi:MAG: nickel transporter [Gammaproteobacteria bacterium]|nr:MAG: nickel transporter [Gammaproteobacteria bacterium]